MQKEYLSAYRQLNPAQKLAVDTIDGPVLVVAGPGTGKTQLLSLRVANILQNTDSDPSNIICLTFTNKAALNMRERLYKIIGASSRDVNVKTFHSFAAEIMNQYPDNFWNGARLSVAPDAVQLDIIREVLSTLPLSNPLSSTFAGSFTALNDVRQALKLTKEAGLNPTDLKDIIKLNLDYIDKVEPHLISILSATLAFKNFDSLRESVSNIPSQTIESNKLIIPLNRVIKDSLELAISQDSETNKTKNVGKWKSRWIQTVGGEKGMSLEKKRNEWWLSVADVYEQYRKILHQRGYYDFSDMLIEVLDQLDQSEDMKADLQERYPYILIDEFQDTNAAQLKLAHLIADHYSANNRPNIMAVGDDDQSIFAFNGAELNNMLHFQTSYPETKLIVLTDNYRSTQEVLDYSEKVISLADDRLVKRVPGLSKQLVAHKSISEPSNITHISYPTRQHQLQELATTIQKLWDSGETSIAVLARKHDSLEQLAGTLNSNSVPIRYERRSNILAQEAVEQIVLISKTVVAIAEGNKSTVNSQLAELLRHPMWGISPKSLWKLAISNYSRPDWFNSLLDNDDEHLKAIGNWLAWLARRISDEPLPLLMEYIVGLQKGQYLVSPFKNYFIDLRPLKDSYIQSLSAISILKGLTFEFTDQKSTLVDFVKFIDLNYSTKTVIADESWFVSGDKAVELLTVHKAKGLEYDHVFILDSIESMWRPRAGGRSSPANLQLQSYGENYDDYIRLLYVAITRAKVSFTATSFSFDDKGNTVLPTPLISSLPLISADNPKNNSIEILENDLRWPQLNTKDEKQLLSDRLENLSISQTALIDFLNIAEAGPASFLERHLLRIPKTRSPNGSYGTAIHASLETAQRLINTGSMKIGTVLDRFESALKDEHLNPVEFKQYFSRGEELLNRLLQDNLLALSPGAKSEQKISDILIKNARINGKIDLIAVGKDHILISDYKTGKPLNSFDTKDKTKAVKAWRHRNQLIYYTLLVKHSPRYKPHKNVNSQMIYLEADNPQKMILSYMATDADLDKMATLLNAVWNHVINLNFPDVSHYSEDIEGIAKFEIDLIEDRI